MILGKYGNPYPSKKYGNPYPSKKNRPQSGLCRRHFFWRRQKRMSCLNFETWVNAHHEFLGFFLEAFGDFFSIFFFTFCSMGVSLRHTPIEFIVPNPDVDKKVVILVSVHKSNRVRKFYKTLFCLLSMDKINFKFDKYSTLS